MYITHASVNVPADVIKYTENITSADLLNFARQVATGMVSYVDINNLLIIIIIY